MKRVSVPMTPRALRSGAAAFCLCLSLAAWSPLALAALQDDPNAPEDAPAIDEPEPTEPAAALLLDCEPIIVQMTSPQQGATAVGPASFTLAATADAPPCNITKIDFLVDGALLHTDTTAPYSYTWTNVLPGSYALTAKATDEINRSKISVPRSVTVTSPISIALTSPSNGTVALAPASFTLNATATDSTGTITKVEFYANGSLINADVSSPYSYTYSNVPAGSYALTAKATDNHGIVTTSSAVNVVSNAAPAVSLTSPANGASGLAPASFTLTATASDSDGSISQVEFYSNGDLINTDTAAPYTYVYTGVGSGSYAITAKAYDNRNAVKTSAAVNVSVNAPPTVALTSPVNGANAIAPASFTLTANASDSDGSISKVEFYSNGALINTDTAPPYTYSYTNRPVGNYALTAKAYDNLNATKTSATVNVSVIANGAPTVSLTSPSNGATATAPANFTLNATANDADGSVAKVEFFSNGALIVADSTPPYSTALTGLTPGNYVLTARATDNLGLATTSVAATVTVNSSGALTVTRTYVYDTYQRLCKTINPETGATIVDYDGAGNLAWSVEGSTLTSGTCDRASVPAGAKTTRSYDARNRVRSVVTPGAAADLTTTYFPDGQVASISANNPGAGPVLTQYSYNKRRLLVAESVSQDTPSVAYTLQYGYNANGHVANVTYPDLQVVGYAPNALGQATQVGSYATGISYYPNGAIKQFTYGNGAVHTMTQNTRLLPTRSRDVKGTTVILDDTYDFDKNGNITDITDQAQGGLTTRGMAYDNRDRLTAAVAPGLWGDASYTYDGLDNLRTADQGARKYRYSYAPNQRLTQINDPNGVPQITLGYDAAGNVSIKNNQALVFDVANRLTQVTGVQSYRYDGLGRRVQTTDQDGKTTFWQYSQAGQVLYASEARKSRNTAYIYLGNTQVAARHVAWGSGSVTVDYEHTDALGSPVAHSNAAGTVTSRNSYTPYGEAYNAPIDGPGYTGHVMDAATGLTYMQQRYYDPQIGRFLSIDPATPNGNTGSNFNRYWYANNSPYRFTDPDGRRTREGPGGAGAGYIGNSIFGVDVNSAASIGMSTIPKSWLVSPAQVSVGPVTAAHAPAIPAPGPIDLSWISKVLSRLRGGVWALPLVIGGDTRKQEGTNLYRVVGAAEQVSIAVTGGYSPAPNGFMAKQFWTSRGDAQLFASAEAANLPGAGATTRYIVTSWVSNDTARMGARLWLDGMSAISFDIGALGAVNADAARSGGIRTVQTLEPSD